MTLSPPEPDLTPDQMVTRASAMRPMLRARQAECEAIGRIPEATNDTFVAAGFYRIVQPRRFGGYEFDVPTFFRVMMEVARGCPESGWVLALTAGHTHLMASFSEEGQRDAYGQTGEFRGPAAFNPPGTAIPVEGGFLIQGTWDYASGCDIATHFLGLAIVKDAGAPAPRGNITMLFDRKQIRIVDNWRVMGMQGTGSRRVIVEETFVPTRRTMLLTTPQGEMVNVNDRPGRGTHDNPMYLGRTRPFLVGEASAVAVGAARGALDIYEEILRGKRTHFPPFQERFKEREYQRHFGMASALVYAAEAALIRAGEEYMAFCTDEARKAGAFDDVREARITLIEQQCVNMAWQAVELMFRTGGTSAANAGAPLGRYFRNLAVITTHLALQHEHSATNAAQLHLGLPPVSRL
jgi:3-hydroxy-9,10-secoandrosta-1,3,5(10)-triene-9,17-dione monooxygenase